MTASEHYYAYLKQRSQLGLWYRRYWLYPRLCRHLKGHTLDVGCGIGDFLRHRPDTTGVDINPLTVEWCQQQDLDAHLMQTDRLPFNDSSFDSVVLDNVLEHLSTPNTLLKEIRRALHPNGILVVGVPGRRGFASDPDHKVNYDATDLVATVAAQGFTQQALFHTPLRLEWLNQNMRQYCIYGVFKRD
jgi:SAM-dependent methyltransferase